MVLQLCPVRHVPSATAVVQTSGCIRILRRLVLVSISMWIYSLSQHQYSVIWVLVLLFVRETKGKTLEELDQVFAVPAHTHAAYGLRQIPYGIRKFVLWQKVQAEELYTTNDSSLDGDLGKPTVEHKEKVISDV